MCPGMEKMCASAGILKFSSLLKRVTGLLELMCIANTGAGSYNMKGIFLFHLLLF